jgi:NADH dehydrogenase FAD-containing subunit
VLSKQKNTEVLLGEAMDIDPQNNRLTLRDGAQVEYDSLIVSTGSQTSYNENDSWRETAPSLKTVEEATTCGKGFCWRLSARNVPRQNKKREHGLRS